MTISVRLAGKDITHTVKPPVKIEDDFTYGAVKVSLEFKHLKEQFDVRCGMYLEIELNGVIWFEGFVWDWGRSFSNDASIVAYDPFIYLIKSNGDFEWRTKNATLISNELFGKYGIKVNSVVGTNHIFEKILCRGQDYESIYTILITIWHETKKRDGKKYWMRYENGAKVFVRTPPPKVPILTALTHSELHHSIEDLINDFKIVDREKNIVVTQSDDNSISRYGRISRVEEYTAVNKADAMRFAKQRLAESSMIDQSYKATAVVPIEAERLWCGDYVYTPDSDRKNIHGNYIKKIAMDIYSSHIMLDMELTKSAELPTMAFVTQAEGR